MKHFLFFLVLTSGLVATAKETAPRILDNDIARVTLVMRDRPEAEPVSQPNEVVMTVECKKGFKQKKKSESVNVCSADLQASKGIEIDAKTVKFFHYMWDAKASNNLEGRLYCDTKNKHTNEFKLSDFCESQKK